MRRRRAAVALAGLLVATAAISGCGDSSTATPASPYEPGAGQWKTRVLSSPAEVRVPPPPASGSPAAGRDQDELTESVDSRTAAQEADARRWNEPPAMAPWMRDAMDFVSQRPKDPPYSSRAYAYVAVAMYDAAVAATYWQQRYDRAAPDDDALLESSGPSYPSAYAAMAGAASHVLHYLFPEHPAQRLDQDAEQAARSRVIAGVSYPTDVQAGLDLGHSVADRVIAHAKTDGIALKWDGIRPPHTPAYWDPPPGSAALPVEPTAGEWRTWVIKSGSEFRAVPPPPYGSPRFDKAVQRMIDVKRNLTPDQKRIARFWAGGQGTPLPAGIWVGVMINYLKNRELSVPREARVFALASIAMADAGVASWDTKYRYWYPRPENGIRDSGADSHWRSFIPTPFFPAYVSGHASYSGAVAQVLSYLFPADADTWHARADEAARSRILGGIHWPFDSSEGLIMGRKVGDAVVAAAKQDGAGP